MSAVTASYILPRYSSRLVTPAVNSMRGRLVASDICYLAEAKSCLCLSCLVAAGTDRSKNHYLELSDPEFYTSNGLPFWTQ